jgi:predicted nucleotidyltransferase
MQQVTWKNTASTKNIPAQLHPLVSQIIKVYQDYYQANLRAIYLNGSLVRGEWKPGNDIDVIGFVTGNFARDDPQLAQLLAITLQGSGVKASNIDPLTITDAFRNNPTPRMLYRMMILSLDGVCVWGDKIDLPSVPTDPVTFASRLYFDFKAASDRYSSMSFDGSKDILRRAKKVAKMVLRLANGIAVINGAPFSSSYVTSLQHIKQSAPEWYDQVIACYSLRQKPQLNAADFELLCATLNKLVAHTESLGITFALAKNTGKNT